MSNLNSYRYGDKFSVKIVKCTLISDTYIFYFIVENIPMSTWDMSIHTSFWNALYKMNRGNTFSKNFPPKLNASL